jgi:uracil-DNA glycosylase
MDKARELQKIARQIAACRICKKDKVGVAVPGEGNPDAKIVFIGEAPGKQESLTGRPFIGRSGKLLRSLIADAGLKDSDIFIASPVKYLPKHVTPRPAEIAHGRIHLLAQLKIIKPKVLVLLGRVACLAMLERNCSISSEHGKIIESDDGLRHFLSYHPAAALHAPNLRPTLVADFKKLKRLIGKLS